MKKYIITIMLALGMIINVSAQGDGFFSFGSNDSRGGTAWSETPRLPDFNSDVNQSAPLGGGLILLAGMAFAYGLRKK